MGQHQVYNGVIKSRGAIKMTHKELRTMLKQLNEFPVTIESAKSLNILAI